MKNLIYIFFIVISISSCDLELQTVPEFTPEKVEIVTFKEQTVWDWLQTKNTPAGTAANSGNFDSLNKAIVLAGMEVEFQSTNPDRTFLLLNNNAWIGTAVGKINRDLTGATGRGMNQIPVAKLKALLQYHIIDAYVDQREALPSFAEIYMFQSLIPGETGRISAARNDRYSITINSSPLIPTSTKRSVNVFRHNYVFKYGIMHQLDAYARYAPF